MQVAIHTRHSIAFYTTTMTAAVNVGPTSPTISVLHTDSYAAGAGCCLAS